MAPLNGSIFLRILIGHLEIKKRHFPVYCDEIFVPGYSTFRFLGFFGNRGKTEITGLPRFDNHNLNS